MIRGHNMQSKQYYECQPTRQDKCCEFLSSGSIFSVMLKQHCGLLWLC